MTVVTNKDFYIKTIHSTSLVTIKCHFITKFKCKLQDCSKCPPFVWTRHEVVNATGRSCHRWRFAPDCPTRQSNATSDRQRLASSPNKCGPASYPTQGWGRGCWKVADWQQWKTEPLAAVAWPSHEPYRPVGALSCWKNEEVARNCTDIGQHLMFQQHAPDILSIYFDARVHKYEVGKNSLVFMSK